MTGISGAQSVTAVKVASTWGTAVAAGAGCRFPGAESTPNYNVTRLQGRATGSGEYMRTDVTRGAYFPTVSITADLGYRNNCDVIIAAFMGTAAAPTEVTASQGDYKHSVFFNTNLNAKYLSYAYTDTNSTSIEFPTCAVRSIGISTQSVPGYLDFTCELLANTFNTPGVTNTYALLTGGTVTSTESEVERVACDLSDAFRTNAQSGGSIATGNLYSIISANLSLTRPQDLIAEIKGSAGFSAPKSGGVMEGTFAVDVAELVDQGYYIIWSAETAQKALLDIQGTQIGSGTNKTFKILLPKLKLVDPPQYANAGEGTNNVSMTFEVLKATSVPTGMAAGSNGYPYFEITNTLATSLLA